MGDKTIIMRRHACALAVCTCAVLKAIQIGYFLQPNKISISNCCEIKMHEGKPRVSERGFHFPLNTFTANSEAQLLLSLCLTNRCNNPCHGQIVRNQCHTCTNGWFRITNYPKMHVCELWEKLKYTLGAWENTDSSVYERALLQVLKQPTTSATNTRKGKGYSCTASSWLCKDYVIKTRGREHGSHMRFRPH